MFHGRTIYKQLAEIWDLFLKKIVIFNKYFVHQFKEISDNTSENIKTFMIIKNNIELRAQNKWLVDDAKINYLKVENKSRATFTNL